jgi:putative transposase
MRKTRFTSEQIIGFIKQAEAGMAVAELGRQHGFSLSSFYAWQAPCGGMEAEDAKRLKELESEND